ncbi:MAG: kelch repeat-containing protein [Bacteroidota bacterium]
MKKYVFPVSLALIVAILGCQEDEEIIISDTEITDLEGYVQKGPFINGTAITLSELDEKLVATGKNFTTQIADNRGSFSLKDIELESEFVQLQAEGFYFDEVKGERSAAQLTLFALADISDASSVNVNLLSHLERNRVVYLMQEEELEFQTAKNQAQQEILTAFGIVSDSIGYSERLDISQDGEQNAILLAISAILQGNNSVAELSELTANLITDLREDGTLNSEATKTKLKEQAKLLDLPQIRKNLKDRYTEMGVEATISNFEQYIDSDGDGILNKNEDDTPDDFTFETQVDVAVNDTIISNTVTITGLKENGITVASVVNGWLVLNGSVVEQQAIGLDNTDTTSANVAVMSVAEIKNNDKISVRVLSSGLYDSTIIASLVINGQETTFKVATKANPFQRKNDFPLDEDIVVGFKANNLFFALTTSNALYEYSPINDTWKRKTEFEGEARMRATCFSIDNKGYVGLGSTVEGSENGSEKYLKDFWMYDSESNSWTRVADFGGESRGEAYSFIIGSTAYIGLGSLGRTFYKDTWVYDPMVNNWTKKIDFPDNGRNNALTLTYNGKGYVGMGRIIETNSSGDFWSYNPQTNSWSERKAYPDGDNSNGIGLVIDDVGYVITDNYGTSLFYRYYFEENHWEKIEDIDTYIHPESIAVTIEGKGYYLNPESGILYEFTPPQE